MQVRCPRCNEVESYAEDVAWRKIPCKSCNHGFTVTTALIAGGRSEGAKARPPGSPAALRPARDGGAGPVKGAAASRPARLVAFLVIGVLAVGNALFARAWLSARHRSGELAGGPDGAAPGGGAGAAGASGDADGGVDDAELVLELQRARIEELEGELAKTKTLLERAEKALEREDGAHAKTKEKLSGLLKENSALRREVDRCAREVRALERRLERGR